LEVGILGSVVEAIVVISVLSFFVFFLFMNFKEPEWFPRLGARLCFAFMSESERRSLARAFPTVGYYYFGTTGDEEKDARIRRSTRLYGRGFVIVSLSGILFMFLLATVIGIFS
jgi:hypothetical protein